MEFLDEESRPRLLFQSRQLPKQSPGPEEPQTTLTHLRKPSLLISLSLSSLLFALSLFYLHSEPFKSLLLWSALSLLLGPFAPSSLTAGDIRVGLGSLLPPPPPLDEDQTDSGESVKKTPNRRSKPRKPEELGLSSIPVVVNQSAKPEKIRGPDGSCSNEYVVEHEEEREWSEGDVELLKKQIVKHPVGKPGRWEAIAEAFKGRHAVENVIKKAKSMGEKKTSDSDSFTRFLKDRKPMDKRSEGGAVERGEVKGESDGGVVVGWSAGEDIALLNALKAFTKDVSMRWEKIADAVPGKSKAACMKRVAELKRDFRSSKASGEA